MANPLQVLYEDNHLLVVNKPAGLATMGTAPQEPSLWRVACDYIRHKYHKPGNVFLGVVSRLDALVTGVVVLARTSKAAARLSEQFREGQVVKVYWALVEQPPQPPSGICEDGMIKDENAQRMRAVSLDTPGAQRARLQYRTLGAVRGATLVEIQLETGRKHQIRVQLSERGWPIVGDRKYGAKRAWPNGIGLHARFLEFVHPVRHEPMSFTAPAPAEWGDLARLRLGG